jgi:hypothetical protein
MKCVVEMDSGGMIYVPSSITNKVKKEPPGPIG